MDSVFLINALETIQADIRENHKVNLSILEELQELDLKHEARFQKIEKDVSSIKTVWATVLSIGAFIIGLFTGK